ncbi:MAG: glycosyltransferase [Ignavibacteriaceae bacterium]|jgi:glycosyltransferase involved in cell wall biosynthesis
MLQKVLFTDITGLPFYEGGAKSRILGELSSLRESKYNISLLCYVEPFYLIKKFKKIVLFKNEMTNSNIKLYILPSLPLKRYLFIRKINEYYLGLFTSILVMKKKFCILHSQTSNASKIATIVKKIVPKVKVVADIHGIEPEEYLLKKNKQQKDEIYFHLEKTDTEIIKYADWNIYSSRSMYRYYIDKYGIEHLNYSIIPCVVNAEYMKCSNLTKRMKKKEELEINDKIIFCYSGTVAAYQMIEETLQLFKQINNIIHNSYLLILTPDDNLMEESCKKKSLSKTTYKIINVRPVQLTEYLQIADFGFLIRDKILVNKVSSPVKFGDYLMNGVPIIATNEIGDISNTIKEEKLGFILKELSVNSDLLEFIMSVTTNRAKYTLNCQNYIKEVYNWRKFSEVIVDTYNSVLTTPKKK